MTTQSQAPKRWQPMDIGALGPTPWQMAKGFTAIRSDPLSFLARTHDRFGDLTAFPVPGPPVLLIGDPADAHRILRAPTRRWTKETIQYSALSRVTGPGLLASAEANWIDHRRIAAPAFHHERLDAIGGHVRSAADEALATWPTEPAAGTRVDVASLTKRIALDIVGRALFSTDLSEQAARLLHASGAAAELVVRLGRSVVPVPAGVPTPLNRALRSAQRELDATAHDLIVQRRAARAGHTSHGDDLLGILLDSGLGDGEVRDEVVTMVVAGHETVAAGLAWAVLLLAQHPQAQQQLHVEVDRLTSPIPMFGAGRVAPFCRAVVDETLRLYPPAWVLSRRSTRPETIGSLAVPSGTTTIISPWLHHRDARWWTAPDEFRPERFVGEEPSPTAYLPFGAGPRLCIGRDFAVAEMVIVLSRMVSTHAFGLERGQQVLPSPEARVALHPRGGAFVVATPRTRTP